MIIERISLNQIKFTLSSSDLQDRNIKLTELAYGTEKTQALFREMMERANSECGFDSENTPLLIEAVPLAIDSIVIIVTKVTDAQDIEEKFNLLPRSKEASKFKQKGLIESKNEKARNHVDDNTLIYSFLSLDDAINLSTRLQGVVNATSILFKNENKYYLHLELDPSMNQAMALAQQSKDLDPVSAKLLLSPNLSPTLSIDDIDAIMSEFGQRHFLSKYYLMEHGEIIVNHSAIDTLSKLY